MNKYRAASLAACMGMLLFGVSLITLGSVTLWLRERLLLDNISAGTLFSILPIGIIVGSLVLGQWPTGMVINYFLLSLHAVFLSALRALPT